MGRIQLLRLSFYVLLYRQGLLLVESVDSELDLNTVKLNGGLLFGSAVEAEKAAKLSLRPRLSLLGYRGCAVYQGEEVAS